LLTFRYNWRRDCLRRSLRSPHADRATPEDPRRRRRLAPARPAQALPFGAGLRRGYRARFGGHGPQPHARPLRPAGPRPHAARRGWTRDLPPATRLRQCGGGDHAHREGRRRGPHRGPRDGGRRLPRQAVQSARAGGAHPRGAAAPGAAGGARRADAGRARGALRTVLAQPGQSHAHARGRAGAAHDRRVRAAQGARAAPARADVARQAHGARARARARELRPLHRRAGVAPAQAPRGGSAVAALHPDGVGLRLRVHPRRRGAEMTLLPASLLWRTLAVMVAALVLSQAAAVWLMNEYVTQPRHEARVGQFVSHLKTISAALNTMQPQAQQRFIDAIAEKEGIRIIPVRGDETMRPAEGVRPLHLFRQRLREIFGPEAEVYVRRGERDRRGPPPVLWIRLPAGSHDFWVAFPRGRIDRDPVFALLAWSAVGLAIAIGATFFLVYRLNRPLAELSRAAVKLGKGGDPAPVSE